MAQTLYDKYGGFASVSRVVLVFYDSLLDSDRLAPFFDEVDMKRLMDHQTRFITQLLGGPVAYSNERLAAAHANLGISSVDFEEMKLLLDTTLSDAGFEPKDREAVMAEIEARRGVVVTAA